MIVRWIVRQFRAVLARCHPFHVGDGRGDTFFTRYDLLRTRGGSVYLHEFHRSDKDRCLHNHPWAFWTLIVRGGYWEELTTGRVWRPPGYLGRYPAEYFHRIELDPDPDRPRPWSIVWVGPKVNQWGFRGPDGFVPWSKDQPNPICETIR